MINLIDYQLNLFTICINKPCLMPIDRFSLFHLIKKLFFLIIETAQVELFPNSSQKIFPHFRQNIDRFIDSQNDTILQRFYRNNFWLKCINNWLSFSNSPMTYVLVSAFAIVLPCTNCCVLLAVLLFTAKLRKFALRTIDLNFLDFLFLIFWLTWRIILFLRFLWWISCFLDWLVLDIHYFLQK